MHRRNYPHIPNRLKHAFGGLREITAMLQNCRRATHLL
jgi:hypothetical protein